MRTHRQYRAERIATFIDRVSLILLSTACAAGLIILNELITRL